MNSIEICIPFIVAILGVAYPILLQVISSLGEKYDSVLLASIFKKEWEYKAFKWALYIALGVLLAYGITRIIGITCCLVVLSEIVLIFFTTCLIISFFLLVHKILIYYDRSELTKYFIKKDKQSDIAQEQVTYFKAIAELLYWAIKSQDGYIALTISDYFGRCFNEYREKKEYRESGYPIQYLRVTNKATSELLRVNDNKIIYIEEGIVFNWLLGENGSNRIPERTYFHLWQNLRQCVVRKRDDLIIQYWKRACQYFSWYLKSIPETFDEYGGLANKSDVYRREEERKRFLENNYVLCGLLLYQKRYDCIRRLLNYTYVSPPDYVLLPQTMEDIFELFFEFVDNNFNKRMEWVNNYRFPKIEGVYADDITLAWTRKYIALLFLRQYTLSIYYTYQEHVKIPILPSEKKELRLWLQYIDYFKEEVSDILSNEKLMKGVGLGTYGEEFDEWCKKNKKLTPDQLFNNTETEIKEKIGLTKVEQGLSPERVNKFMGTTKKRVSNFLSDCDEIKNGSNINSDYNSEYSSSIQRIVDKDVFVDSNHANFDSSLADAYVENLGKNICQQFFSRITSRYLLDKEDLFKGVDRLNIVSPNDYIIIVSNLSLGQFKSVSWRNNKWSYKEIEINNSLRMPDQFLIVMKKADLPCFMYWDIKPELKKDYELNELDNDKKLYASVVDLNKKTDLWGKLPIRKETEVDLRTKVLLRIEQSIGFRWKDDIEMVQLKLYSTYYEQGVPNKLEDIQPMKQ